LNHGGHGLAEVGPCQVSESEDFLIQHPISEPPSRYGHRVDQYYEPLEAAVELEFESWFAKVIDVANCVEEYQEGEAAFANLSAPMYNATRAPINSAIIHTQITPRPFGLGQTCPQRSLDAFEVAVMSPSQQYPSPNSLCLEDPEPQVKPNRRPLRPFPHPHYQEESHREPSLDTVKLQDDAQFWDSQRGQKKQIKINTPFQCPHCPSNSAFESRLQ